jgi:hypothetical protein
MHCNKGHLHTQMAFVVYHVVISTEERGRNLIRMQFRVCKAVVQSGHINA